jgi:non-heme chloroperoxidase
MTANPQPTHPTDAEQVDRANATGRTPVVFIHGLWLLPNSWDRWGPVFERTGYAPMCPGWPDDPETVAEANAHPEVFGPPAATVPAAAGLGS